MGNADTERDELTIKENWRNQRAVQTVSATAILWVVDKKAVSLIDRIVVVEL